jgi:phosphoglucosamine mutase
VKENIRVGERELPELVTDEVERLNEELDGSGRVLVRPSGTEPVIRISRRRKPFLKLNQPVLPSALS